MKANIGKNTLGDTGKMSLNMREYGRSTHNLSYAWRSTMGVGVLTPFMVIPALPGDTFEIDLENKILTSPTIGPLFGSFKFQADIFTCPVRLYNAMLHNNALNIGMDMKKVKLPKYLAYSTPKGDLAEVSSIYEYLNDPYGSIEGYKTNAVPLLGYYDIFKNYYANKQEDKFPVYTGVSSEETVEIQSANITEGREVIRYTGDDSIFKQTKFQFTDEAGNKYNILGEKLAGSAYKGVWESTYDSPSNQIPIRRLVINSEDIEVEGAGNISNNLKSTGNAIVKEKPSSIRKIELFNLEEIDDLRELILSKGKQEVVLDKNTGIPFIKAILNGQTRGEKLGGLCLKTYQSDINTNWIKKEWVEGDNGISAITKIDTSSGSFSLDTLNLAKKVYEMLNRIAISGGSYKDWIETVYTTDYYFRAETPVYEGGMSSEIEFQEIVSNSASEADGYEPLGTLAGRGVNTSKKGGKITIKVNEPSYIIGIASITPRVDYSYFRRWDARLETLDDFHKPQLDGIGFQDRIQEDVNCRATDKRGIGKQPAWIQYTTAINETHGEFSERGNMSYMVLNRNYRVEGATIQNASSYIEPEMYNNIFATTGTQEQNFQVQIGAAISARRVMSARQIPNF